jgi:hypothetical protein
MIRGLFAAGITLLLAGHVHTKTPAKKPPAHAPPAPLPAPIWVRPAPPIPMLPRIGRVRVEAAKDRVVVVEDVLFPRGDWESGGLDLYVAFGSPGTPIAIDARLIVPSSGGLDAHPEEAGDPVALESAPQRTAGAQALLGKSLMAGVVAHVKESQLRRAYAAGDVAVLRLRSLLVAPAADASGARDVVVRLGASGGVPLTLARIQVGSLEAQPWVARAEAVLCGPEASPLPLAVTLIGKIPGLGTESHPSAHPSQSLPTIVPEFAVRHASDDLCIRWWGSP